MKLDFLLRIYNKVSSNKAEVNTSASINPENNISQKVSCVENDLIINDEPVGYTTNVFDVRKNNDFKTTHIFDNDSILAPICAQEIFTKYKNDGSVEYKRVTQPSDVVGVYNVEEIDNLGNKKILSFGKINPDGSTIVHKNFNSLDGTNTLYNYFEDVDGNKKILYQIKDKDGKLLFRDKQSFEVLSDSKVIHKRNNDMYVIAYGDSKISVNDIRKNKTTEIELNDLINSGKNDLQPILKKLGGDELIKLKDNVGALSLNEACESGFNFETRDISISPHESDLSTLLHELGHAKDCSENFYSISGNSEFQKINEYEKQLYENYFSEQQSEFIDYFTHIDRFSNGYRETVAETNSLLNSPINLPNCAIRAHYLQQFFPKSIAYLAKNCLLNN